MCQRNFQHFQMEYVFCCGTHVCSCNSRLHSYTYNKKKNYCKVRKSQNDVETDQTPAPPTAQSNNLSSVLASSVHIGHGMFFLETIQNSDPFNFRVFHIYCHQFCPHTDPFTVSLLH
ncbi:unnamed protein product [Strongylus vulgaris]|uniref:Uncharacterized protein n=1 Tax=Strongylus vulgaris TaxID=40348 RepID=A0A3P7KW87_STRVU|nr:unnamed protein product [Strongylus vulgaris]